MHEMGSGTVSDGVKAEAWSYRRGGGCTPWIRRSAWVCRLLCRLTPARCGMRGSTPCNLQDREPGADDAIRLVS